MEDVFIYTIFDPILKIIIYVGKTKQPEKRFYSHTTVQKTLVGIRIKEIIDAGQKPVFNIIEKCSYAKGFDREKFWINHHLNINPNLLNRPCGAKKLKELPYIINVENNVDYIIKD